MLALYKYPVSGSLNDQCPGAAKDLNRLNIDELIKKEGWHTIQEDGAEYVIAEDQKFKKVHPLAIHFKLYREATNPDNKYNHLVAAHHYIWPQDIITWNYWSERRFRTYCEGWNIISWASGQSTGKSVDAGKLALLEWFCAPSTTGVLVVSTTLESIKARVYGYILRYLKESAVQLPYQIMRSNPPKVLHDRDDELHAISTIAAAKGRDNEAFKNYIGRHPKRKLLLVLDEGPDLDPIILESLPNLEKEGSAFQVLCLGNSASKFDLHGSLSTPKNGWNSINPKEATRWETTQKNGLCLYFSCYESPAIYEQDPIKKAALSKFLITADQIKAKIEKYGEDTDAFHRFVLGFWRSTSTDDTVISPEFVAQFNVTRRAEWSGLYPLHVVAGLDPAFSVGGDSCILRLAILGQTTSGQIVLDFRGTDLLFNIKIRPDPNTAAEIQIADQVIEIMKRYNVDMTSLVIDSNGQGRAISSVIQLRANSLKPPLKIYGTRGGNAAVKSFDVIIKTAYELWAEFRNFIQHGQIKGMDNVTLAQLTTRLTEIKNKKPQLESKQDYKVRMGAIMPALAHSPDEADAASLALQSAIINYGFSPGQVKAMQSVQGMLHEKYWVFNKVREMEAETTRGNPPVANFSGDITDLTAVKSRFSS